MGPKPIPSRTVTAGPTEAAGAGAAMRIRYIHPVGATAYAADMAGLMARAKRTGTTIEVVTLPAGRPRHLEYHAYEAQVIRDVVAHARAASEGYDAVIIGGFYDLGLREAREVSGAAVVTAPCEAACAIARSLANRFSVLVGKRKWIPKMAENVRRYGHGRAMASMRALGMGVHEFQSDSSTAERMRRLGRMCIEHDGAEALILGCTAEYGFHERLQGELGVPVIDRGVHKRDPLLSARARVSLGGASAHQDVSAVSLNSSKNFHLALVI